VPGSAFSQSSVSRNAIGLSGHLSLRAHHILKRVANGTGIEWFFEAGNARVTSWNITGPHVTCLKDEGNVMGSQSISDKEGRLAPQVDVEDHTIQVCGSDDVERGIDASYRSDNLAPRGGNLAGEVHGDDVFVFNDQDAFATERHG
jgi:hypothetical protein